MRKFMYVIQQWLKVPTTDPDNERRRKSLNILLIGFGLIVIFFLVLAIYLDISNATQQENIKNLYGASMALLAYITILFFINRYIKGWLAGLLFLVLFTALIVLADEPHQVVEGRTSILFAIPIFLSSFLLRPWASFVMAGIINVSISLITIYYLEYVPPIPTMLVFFMTALISWLMTRSFENALYELRLINQELDQRFDELKELDRKKSEFLSTISHELRSPLTSIKSCLENTLSGMYGPISKKQRQRLSIALACANEEARLVQNSLDLSRIQKGHTSIDMRLESISEIIHDVCHIFEYDFSEKNIDWQINLHDNDALTTLLDREKIKRVLSNLVHNAVKFTPSGGMITITAGNETDWLKVQVIDNGVGIPQAELTKIFDRFYQVDSSLTREVGGTGIGLNIAKEYVILHGGKIWAESQVGQGAIFTFTLPKKGVNDIDG